ncbi:MAG: YHYH domain-containing protein [Deltaproteobacteria bacterium]|nr:YHYH domain-containing protein [Deltaproteobacteria bacterium]
MATVFALAFPAILLAHPGALDARGGHRNRATGRYHCHTKACRGGGTSAADTPTIRRVSRVADIPSGSPATGHYRIHLIDVGTGLAVLVQGSDFNLRYDGGSQDDSRGLRQRGRTLSRLHAYLWAAVGGSGPNECTPDGDAATPATAERTIHHVVLSHPHEDHVSMLDEVLFCYRVRHVWDAGVPAETVTYTNFLAQVALEAEARYHTASAPTKNRTRTSRGQSFRFPRWTSFGARSSVELGRGATMTVLYANGQPAHDPNQNSVVVRLDLGTTSLLLTGDAESGPRLPPDSPPGDAEAWMLANVRELLDVDILQVGHHGSLTSSRRAFLDAVSPTVALIGSGPHEYSGVRLPDPEIETALRAVGARVLGTYEHDGGGCDVSDRVGMDDERPGGCDNWILELASL